MRSAPAPLSLPHGKVVAVQRAVVAWYRANARDLPWRRTRDPYAVLVSELMLQQQTVRHVTPVFLRFLERFPTLEALACASRAEVIRVWQPLGRYASAVRLHAIARHLVENDAASGAERVPRTVEALLELAGIGRYTAGAIVCFAYDVPAPLVDTNVRRVLGRLFAADAPGASEDDRRAWRLAEAVLPAGASAGDESPHQTGAFDARPTDGVDAYHWNQGLMDLGAALCIARTPRCGACPVSPWCDFRAASAGALRDAAPDGGRAVAESRAAYGATPPPAPRTPRFEGSRRWYRGQIMQALCALPEGQTLSLAALSRRLTPDGAPAGAVDGPADGSADDSAAAPALLESLIAALARDGLLCARLGPDGGVQLALPE